jgi:hypothetical protein
MNEAIQQYWDRHNKISDSHWEDAELIKLRVGLIETLVTPTPETKALLISTRSGEPKQLDLELGVGWFKIMGECFKAISEEKKRHPAAIFNLLQIKEKFGGLRVYYEAKPQEFRNAIMPFIDHAKDRCAETCEMCSAPGKLINAGWMRVACQEHTKLKD